MKSCLTILATALVSLTAAQQLRLETVPFPQFDFSSFNNQEIGFLGDFDAISQYSYQGATNFTNQNNLTNNLYYTSGGNDQFISLGGVQGSVTKILPVTSDTFLLLGDYTSIGGRNVSSPSTFNATSNSFTEIDQQSQIDGTVTTGLYDSSQHILYLGGGFTFNQTSSAAYYNLTSQTLNSTLFEGFGDDSKINSIIQVGDNIVFGGQFDTLGLPQLLSATYNNSNISVTTDQLVSLNHASFTSSDGSSSADSLSCLGGDEWSADGTTDASFSISLPFTVYPSKIRIFNSADDDSQIQLFRLITIPAAGIMNLTYVDPESGDLVYCDAWCPLLNSTSLEGSASETDISERVLPFYDTSLSWGPTYQDFGFVNQIDVTGFNFEALDSYGSNVALAGFEIYQSMFSTYANNSLNEPACGAVGNYSTSDLTGSWSSAGQYLTTTVDVSGGIPDVGVTFHPNISYAGDYTIQLYTPGCLDDSTCDYRGIVMVELIDEVTNDTIISTQIYQTNNEEKYDTIYSGHLDNPIRLDMSLYSTVLSGDPNQIVVVADRISTTILSIDQLVQTNGTVPINGIFEYSPSNFTRFNAANLTESSKLIGNTTLNLIGASLSDDADVQLVFNDGKIYVGGDFESEYGDNFFVISAESASSTNSTIGANAFSADGGLNGNVSSLLAVDNGVLILGEFDFTNNETEITSLSGDSDDFSGAALYNGTWYSFGDVDSTSASNLTLKGAEYWTFDNESWSVDNATWYEPSTLLTFNVSTAGKSGDSTLFVGSLRTADETANKGVMLSNSTLQGNITTDELSNSTFNTGLFINESLSAFGGDFVTKSGITNLILQSGNDTTGLDIDWDSNTTVTQLFAYENKLFIGTSGKGSVDGNDFNGVTVYNLNNGTFQSIGSLSGSPLSVNQFGYFNYTYLVVGGEFDSADGQDDCSGLCFYNMNETSWTQLIDGFSGKVNSFRFINDTLVAGGSMTYNDTDLFLFAYDFNSTDHSTPDHFSDLDGEVSKLLLVDNSTTGRIIVSGDNFVSAFDGSSWTNITSGLEGSTILDIELFDLGSSNSKNNGSFFDSSQILLASGNLTVNGYGYANVAFYNSTMWLPYAITTHQRSTATVNSIFMNKDQSPLYISGTTTNSTRPSTTSSSAPTSTSSVSKKKSGKMDRGFIVLVGLACAVGTVGLLGALAAFFLFRNKKQEYMPLVPRVNETEMLDTVPPENLLKHV